MSFMVFSFLCYSVVLAVVLPVGDRTPHRLLRSADDDIRDRPWSDP
jgi:hypothetical protein